MTNEIEGSPGLKRHALEAAKALSEYAAAPFFPDTDKRGKVRATTAEWWDGLAELIELSQPLIARGLMELSGPIPAKAAPTPPTPSQVSGLAGELPPFSELARLTRWLDAKYARHKELEDDEASKLLHTLWLAAHRQAQQPANPPTMDDALAAGDGTLHGAIDYWQNRALAAEAARDVDETNKVLADNYLRATAGKAEGESKPFGWYGEYRFENDFTTNEDTSRHWHANGYRLTPLYAAPSHPPIAAPAGDDTRRLDWIERYVCDVSRLGDSAHTLRISWNNGADYAFVGPRYNATWREAIDAAIAASGTTGEASQ